jgi:hypothetical protein
VQDGVDFAQPAHYHRPAVNAARPGSQQASDSGVPVPDRRPALTYVNVNFVHNFRFGARNTFQARFDIQNLLNYAAYNNPITDPTNSNFGRVTTAVASAGAMRFFNFVVRFTF